MKRFIIEQKITAFVNQYRAYDVREDGKKGELLAFAEQKRLALKETFSFFTAEDKKSLAFTLKARQVFDLNARYDVRSSDGELIGVIGKAFGASLLRSTWQVFGSKDENKPIFTARERSTSVAIGRRVWEFIPYISELIPFFIKYHFDFIDGKTSKVVGGYEKTGLIRDHYRLEIEEDVLKQIDWRTMAALGIVMDALQSR